MKVRLLFLVMTSLIYYNNMNAQNEEIVNAGVSGDTTQDLLDRLPEVLNLNPDWILLMVGTNDMLNSNKFISYDDYEKKLKLIVDKLQKKGVPVVLISPPTVDPGIPFRKA